MAAIGLKDVCKIYPGGARAVENASLDIADGEFVVLVGPSGCGKSTLLRMVAGLETATSGEIAIDGKLVNRIEPADRDIAMVFQNYALYPHMSVRQNMAYGLRNRGMAKADVARRVDEAASILQIGEYLDRKPRQLSGGQRQRVAMGRAIVRSPKAFLFDEPLSNLDAKLRVEMRGEIRQLQRRLGTTSVYVTHDQLEAMTLADRLVVLNKGRIEQVGTPLEVYRKPGSTFVASFIGSPAMNLIEAEIGDGEVHFGGHSLPLGGMNRRGGKVILGIRAEDVSATGTGRKAAIGFSLAPSYAEELGSGRLFHSVIGSGRVVFALQQETEISQSVTFVVDPTRLHFFDRQSGLRLE